MSEASKSPPRLILASSSPYRRELLERLRIPFDVVSPDIDETPLANETPEATAVRLSIAKARAAAGRSGNDANALVIGSDQVATFDGKQIGKPGTHEKAFAQLQAMRGRSVEFHSALCLFDSRTGDAQSADIVTRVRFRRYSDAQIETYLRAETPYDCAGSAKAEGLGIALLEAIESDDPTALIGLPLIALTGMLANAGHPVLEAA
ncbi:MULTISPECIES: Maf-like protein [Caballeronia]|jgi:septum formation protein|uniref:7-methyl-GTP pyrophosphatase n=1 Tax=Caballeronia zhejiangensis TaxID=871203 RepID=A0A656QBE0_9BURK|nr:MULTISPECIES: Maf-like protein [Caballeronia]KDR26668.1 septum formation inhibitor Maf [Caballeronia zhejiangensis]MCG7402807.1 Maf-like protein [Caballeronia zhejiangensis]MCI1046204.1 septum formation protein Maf [Caballeronia zhejiangensis]MDR5786809.1 Maf-like protein [Caballeronia sp. LP003]